MFSVQNGLLTPTLKAKRAELRSHFREQIDELYARVKMWAGAEEVFSEGGDHFKARSQNHLFILPVTTWFKAFKQISNEPHCIFLSWHIFPPNIG